MPRSVRKRRERGSQFRVCGRGGADPKHDLKDCSNGLTSHTGVHDFFVSEHAVRKAAFGNRTFKTTKHLSKHVQQRRPSPTIGI